MPNLAASHSEDINLVIDDYGFTLGFGHKKNNTKSYRANHESLTVSAILGNKKVIDHIYNFFTVMLTFLGFHISLCRILTKNPE